MNIELPLSEDDELAALGLAARILLAYDAADGGQMGRLIDADPDAAFTALVTLPTGLAVSLYGEGEGARQCLNAIATSADLDAIAREVTG